MGCGIHMTERLDMPVSKGARGNPCREFSATHRLTPIALAIGCAMAAFHPMAVAAAVDANASPGGVSFNSAFLVGGDHIDLDRYAHGNPVDAGVQKLDVVVNGLPIGRHEVLFVDRGTPGHAVPCLGAELLGMAGLKSELLDKATIDGDGCVDLTALVPDAKASYDSHALRLDVSLPQAALSRDPRGFVNPASWNYGETAAFLNYNANAQRQRGDTQAYASLMAGLNLGAWRLRHRGSLQYSSRRDTHYQSVTSSLERDLPGWRSQMLLGESYTNGQLFEGVSFIGAQVSSDDRMLPDALRGYAPVIRGMAATEARVVVRQNGYVLYEVPVAPGPFVIDDLYPTSYGGDLEVTVYEADGREQRFTVNFAAVPQALREGVTRFSATAGQLRMLELPGGTRRPTFAEGTWARGMNNYLTAIGGAQVSAGYGALLAGSAINTRWGAFGADATMARSRLAGGERHQGTSVRLNYQRNFAGTGTNFGLAAYRYSTRGFYTLAEAARARREREPIYLLARPKKRLQFNFSQRIGERSSLFVSGGHVRYWSARGAQTDYQVGYQSSYRSLSYSASAMRTRDMTGRSDNQVQFTLSMPLGGTSQSTSLNATVQHSPRYTSEQASVSGSLGQRHALSYNLGASHARGSSTSYYGSGSYRNAIAQWSAMAAHSSGSTTTALGASGAIVVHGGGINLSPETSDGFVLVEAQGARGAYVGHGEARIGRNGYAVLPQYSPYRWTSVDINPQGLSHDVELIQTSQRVAPTAGSMVKMTFATRVDTTVYIRAYRTDGRMEIPFGSDVRNDAGQVVGTVAQGGTIRVQGDHGTLIVGNDGAEQCRLQYRVPETHDDAHLRITDAECVPTANHAPADPPAAPNEEVRT